MSSDVVRENAACVFQSYLNEHGLALDSIDFQAVFSAVEMIADILRQGNKIMIAGNGGSAADAQHMAAEMTGRMVKERGPLAAVALTTDTSALTAIANDYGYEDVFARQVMGIGKPCDAFLGISTSGRSKNIINAMVAAHSMGINTIGLTGSEKTVPKSLLPHHSDICIHVDSCSTPRIQEAHIYILHVIVDMLDNCYGFAKDDYRGIGRDS